MDFANLKDDGSRWNFKRKADRKEAMYLVELEDPDWIIGAPPCTAFSVLNFGMNYPKMRPEDVKKKLDEGMVHLRYMCKLYRRQIRAGKMFLHEHPNSAKSWQVKPIKGLLDFGNVYTVKCDQCQFGLETRTTNGGKALAKKPTRFMSNSKLMLRELDKKCLEGHQHQPLMGGRAADAAFYPRKLLRAIVRGMANTKAAMDGTKDLVEEKLDFTTMKTSQHVAGL